MTIDEAIEIACVLERNYMDKQGEFIEESKKSNADGEKMNDPYRISRDKARKLYEAFLNTEILPERNRGKL